MDCTTDFEDNLKKLLKAMKTTIVRSTFLLRLCEENVQQTLRNVGSLITIEGSVLLDQIKFKVIERPIEVIATKKSKKMYLYQLFTRVISSKRPSNLFLGHFKLIWVNMP